VLVAVGLGQLRRVDNIVAHQRWMGRNALAGRKVSSRLQWSREERWAELHRHPPSRRVYRPRPPVQPPALFLSYSPASDPCSLLILNFQELSQRAICTGASRTHAEMRGHRVRNLVGASDVARDHGQEDAAGATETSNTW